MNWSKQYRIEQWKKKQEEKEKQLKEDMVEKMIKDKEFFQNLSPDKQTEYKLFKLFFSIFLIVFFFAADYGYNKGFLWQIVIPEAIITLISFVIWKVKPKKIKFPSVFMMPVLAFALTLLGIGGFALMDSIDSFGLSKSNMEEIKQVSEENEEISDYEAWLRANNILEGDE